MPKHAANQPVPKLGHHSSGFTLVELVITIAILSITLLAVAKSLQFSLQFSADSLWQSRSVALANAYADEIMGQRYDQLSPGGGGSCAPCTAPHALGRDGVEARGGATAENSYNDVDDYITDPEGELPRNAWGAERADYSGYRVIISVTYAGTDLGLSPQAAKKVAISIKPPAQTAAIPFVFYRTDL
ncbi:MAG: prepilin-type N-terminal cleavage/methylation domain-containing protein [Motiliproteus sp.]